MNVEITKKGLYQIFKVKEDITVDHDLSFLEAIVKEYLQKGERKMVVGFTEGSCLYTKSIAVLIRCVQMVRERDGSFGFLEPNELILDTLDLINLDGHIQVFFSETELVG